MLQKIIENHRDDVDGNPAGGVSEGTGILIKWQDGPLGREEDRRTPNGAFVEGVIQAAIGRLEYYQKSKFLCAANANALRGLREALACLEKRTAEREMQNVEGTHEVHKEG